jgi:hypothetical protein
MTDLEGLPILFAWLIFVAFLCVLAYLLLRRPSDVMEESRRRTDGSLDPSRRSESG